MAQPLPVGPGEVSFNHFPAPLAYPGVVLLAPAAHVGTTFTVGSLTPSVCTVSPYQRSNYLLTARAPGACTVWVGSRVGYTTMTFPIDPQPQALGVYMAEADPAVGGGRSAQVLARSSPGAPVALRSATPNVCLVGALSSPQLTGTNTATAGAPVGPGVVYSAPLTTLRDGVCTLTATQAAWGAFAPGEASRSTAVVGGALVGADGATAATVDQVVLDAPPAVPVHGSARVLARGSGRGIIGGFAGVTVSSLSPDVCAVVEGDLVLGLAEGTCTVAATQQPSPSFAADAPPPPPPALARIAVQGPAHTFAALARVTGAIEARTLRGEFFPRSADLGRQGAMFVGATMGNVLLLLGPQGWVPFDGSSVPVPFASGPLAPASVTVAEGADMRPLLDAQLFVGYGMGDSATAAYQDMVASGRLVFAHRVAP